MATYTYTKDINYDKFKSFVFCKSTFKAKMNYVGYDGDGLSNNLHVVTLSILTAGEIIELAVLVAAHDSDAVTIDRDVSDKEVVANAIGFGLAFLNEDSLIVYLFDDMSDFDAVFSVNCALLYDAQILCMNDPDSTCTIYTFGETCDSAPGEAGVEYCWNKAGTVTIYASREVGDPDSIEWTELTRSDVTDISAQDNGTSLRMKIVLTGNAALNWVTLITDSVISA